MYWRVRSKDWSFSNTAALRDGFRQLVDRGRDPARGAPGLEAYPVAAEGNVPAAAGYTGLLSTFEAAGFRVVHEIVSPQSSVRRVIVRHDAD